MKTLKNLLKSDLLDFVLQIRNLFILIGILLLCFLILYVTVKLKFVFRIYKYLLKLTFIIYVFTLFEGGGVEAHESVIHLKKFFELYKHELLKFNFEKFDYINPWFFQIFHLKLKIKLNNDKTSEESLLNLVIKRNLLINNFGLLSKIKKFTIFYESWKKDVFLSKRKFL